MQYARQLSRQALATQRDQIRADGSAANAPHPTLVWTDGACHPNPGPGAWAALIRVPGQPQFELTGFEAVTTNNRMEMFGAIAALEHLGESSSVVIASDSKYLVNGMSRWILGWKRRGWVTKTGDSVLNQDLWQRLEALCSRHQVQWQWVRGHAGHTENERCDALATRCLQEGKRQLPRRHRS